MEIVGIISKKVQEKRLKRYDQTWVHHVHLIDGERTHSKYVGRRARL